MKQFNAESTTNDVLGDIDLSGKRVLVTGVSAGLGVETARSLATRGATIVGTARDLTKGRQALEAAGADMGRIELVELDLSSLASVRACADRILADGQPLDAIIANAGVMACPFGRTVDGFEMQFGTNHLGHFLLINRVAPLLREGARVVVLSSGGHRASDVDLDDPGFERTPYVEFIAYGRSKTANSLFAVEFDRRHRDKGIRAAAVHPGGIQTELTRHMTEALYDQLYGFMPQVNGQTLTYANRPPPRYKTVPQGAATSVWAAFVAPADEIGGRYLEDCQVAPPNDGTRTRGVRDYAIDPERARALWAKSEEMVGERF